ncbi:very short patch repair endonuclease [Terrabacter tumescens]|nr:very short patch repair endonuclease [Terrabacter tumescens]
MSRQRRRDTAPELALRKVLHARGRRFRVDCLVPGLPRRRVDVLFTRAKVAVFVDGCFWHMCPEHSSLPASNSEWWASKLRMNQERDVQTTSRLEQLGWTVVRVWEHVSAEEAADCVDVALGFLRAQSSG